MKKTTVLTILYFALAFLMAGASVAFLYLSNCSISGSYIIFKMSGIKSQIMSMVCILAGILFTATSYIFAGRSFNE